MKLISFYLGLLIILLSFTSLYIRENPIYIVIALTTGLMLYAIEINDKLDKILSNKKHE